MKLKIFTTECKYYLQSRSQQYEADDITLHTQQLAEALESL